MTTSIHDIQAIDVHAHYGQSIHDNALLDSFLTASADEVAARARAVNVEWTVVSPLLSLFPRGKADATVGNEEAARIVPSTPGLLQWVVVNPLDDRTYEQAERMLRTPWCVGIKIHPEEHIYPIAEHGRKLFEFFARHNAVVLTHSGEKHSLPADFIPFADDHPNVKLILAHIGCSSTSQVDLQVRAVAQSKRGNVFADTSSSRSIFPNLIEFAVREIGPERVLFGTDTPLYCTSMQRARIDHADISDADKRLILRDNAAKLLGIDAATAATSSR